MLVITVSTMPANTCVILVLIADVMRLVGMALSLIALVNADGILVGMPASAIEQAVILPMTVMVIHAVRRVCRRVRAGRSIRRGCVGARLKESTTV